MKRFYLSILLAAGLLVGCTDVVQNELQTSTSVEIAQTPSYVIPIEQALTSLEEVLVSINENREERGLKKLIVTERKECIAVSAKNLMTPQQVRSIPI